MRYITAIVGALFIFVGIIVIGFGVTLLVPPLRQPIALPFALLPISAPPAIFVAFAIALPAAIHSFRSTLKRYAEKAEKSRANKGEPSPN